MRHDIVSYIAVPPANQTSQPNDGNTALRTITRELLRHHPVVPAPSLRAIAFDLSRRTPKPKTIQIIGHGSPGQLELGSYWNQRYTDDDQGPFYLLDSNPYAYSVLSTFVRGPMEVVLAGCSVGSNEPSDHVVGGSPLIFDLHNMWFCDVLAADDLVDVTCFHEGRYVGPAQGYVDRRWRRYRGAVQVAPPRVINAVPPGLSDSTIVAAPALGQAALAFQKFVASSSPVTIDPAILNRYSEEVEIKHGVLATNEVTFAAKQDGKDVQAHLLCNSDYLAVVSKKGTRYYRAPLSIGTDSLRSLLKRAPQTNAVWTKIHECMDQFWTRLD